MELKYIVTPAMSLKYKVSLLVVVFFICFGIFDYSIMRLIIIPSFVHLEQKDAEDNLDRCVSAIHRELYHLDKICLDWSSWNDTYEFAQKPTDVYIKSNLIIEQFNPDLFSLLYILDTKGDVVWGGIKDIETKKPTQLKVFEKKRLDKTDPLITFNFQNRNLSEVKNTGIIMTEKGPILLCSRPILTSENKGPESGTLIMGRFLTNAVIKSLIEQTRVPFEIIFFQSASMNTENKSMIDHFNREASFFIEKKADSLIMYAPFYDIYKKPVFIIKTQFPREITKNGYLTIHFAIFSILFVGCIVLLSLLASLYKIILIPLYKLTRFVETIEQDRDFSHRVNITRNDEIGTLAHGLNTMVATIAEQTDLLISANIKLQNLSSLDGLTGIANRRKFDESIEKEWKRMYREKQPLSIIIGDLDYFKNYNDHYGHLAGDSCLKAVAGSLKKHVKRPGDLVARYGGEEFVVILSNTDTQGAMFVAELIRKEVELLQIEHVESKAASHVTVSLGVSSMIPNSDTSIKQLIENADKSLYIAKEEGRNRAVSQ